MEDIFYDYNNGPLTKVSTLPVGTRFHVVNGNWEGEIFEKDGQRYLRVLDTDSEFLLTPDYDLDMVLTILDPDEEKPDLENEICF